MCTTGFDRDSDSKSHCGGDALRYVPHDGRATYSPVKVGDSTVDVAESVEIKSV